MMPIVFQHRGDLGVLAQNETLTEEHGNKTEHLSRQGGENNAHHTSPPPGDLGVLAQNETPIEEHGNKLEHFHTHNAHHTSPPSGDLGVPLAQEKDLMSASFYEQQLQAEAAAPPPHILTDEEVRQFHAEADRQLEEKKKQTKQSYNTFGKMYFPPERR